MDNDLFKYVMKVCGVIGGIFLLFVLIVIMIHLVFGGCV